MYNGGIFNLYGGTIAGNRSAAHGGGVYNASTATFNMRGGTIAYNTAGAVVESASLARYGGGVYNVGSFNMSTGVISNNYASQGGGGISTVGYSWKLGVITLSGDALITENVGGYTGGGIFLGENTSVYMTVDSAIINNFSGNGGNGGVGIRHSGSLLSMQDNATISGNTTTGASAGVYVLAGSLEVSGNASVTDNLIVSAQGDTTGTDSNVYLLNPNTITVKDSMSGQIGVTSSLGADTIATGDNGDYAVVGSSANFISDVEGYYPVEVGDSVALMEAVVTTGNDTTVEYSSSSISVKSMFDFTNITTSTSEYTITGGTGEGTISSSGGLRVSKVGTFDIEVYNPAGTNAPPTTQTATITVEPKAVDVTGVTALDRGVAQSYVVELDETSGYISGVSGSDDVELDFSESYGYITTLYYDSDTTLNETGENTFPVTVHDLSLTGDDAVNYYIDTVNDTEVTIYTAIPYIAWPTAMDLTYGEIREDDDLLGGKVIVKDSGSYVDITSEGEFVWVGTPTQDSAGTHTYDVAFVLDENSRYYDAYSDELANMSHSVSQIVQAVAVTFTIENNLRTVDDEALSITAKDAFGNNVTAFELLYYVGGSWVSAEPTTEGEYLISASFTSENYRHAGTQESTGKQIGAYTIYEDGDTVDTYNATFSDYSQYNITDALPQEIHILPTIDGDDYMGWNVELDGNTYFYDFESRFPQPEYSVTFYAVETPNNGTLSGTISGTDLDGTTGGLSDIAVVLM